VERTEKLVCVGGTAAAEGMKLLTEAKADDFRATYCELSNFSVLACQGGGSRGKNSGCRSLSARVRHLG